MIRTLLSITARLSIVSIFLASAAMQKIPQFSEVAAMMEAKHVPNAKIALAGAIVFLLIGSISVALGYWARFGALLLAVFLCAATYYFHNFWAIEDAALQHVEMQNFMKNLAIFGGLLFIIANGGGAGCLDLRRPAPVQ